MLTSQEKVNLVWERFVHVTEPFAEQVFIHKQKRYEFRPVRVGNDYMSMTKGHVKNHLIGNITLGVYTTRSDQTAKWLCLDVDDTDTELVRRLVQRVEDRFGPNTCLVEFSGTKGYHIWLFFDEPKSVKTVVALGRLLTKDVCVEIYPKQSEIDGIGNLVKLPLGIQKKTGERCWFVDPETFESFSNQWEPLMNVRLISYLGYFPEEPKQTIKLYNDGLPCFGSMMDEGLEEGVRDVGLFKLGCYWRKSGIPIDMAINLAHMVNGKSTRPFSDELVEEKIESAYSRPYSQFPCQEQLLDRYCSSSCQFFGNKAKARHMTVEELSKRVG